MNVMSKRATSALVLEHVLENDPAVVRGVARGVEDIIQTNGRLDFYTRTRLIRRAERLGLKRFDANLIIAAVEHRAQWRASAQAQESALRVPLWIKVAAVVAIQGPILIFFGWIFHTVVG